MRWGKRRRRWVRRGPGSSSPSSSLQSRRDERADGPAGWGTVKYTTRCCFQSSEKLPIIHRLPRYGEVRFQSVCLFTGGEGTLGNGPPPDRTGGTTPKTGQGVLPHLADRVQCLTPQPRENKGCFPQAGQGVPLPKPHRKGAKPHLRQVHETATVHATDVWWHINPVQCTATVSSVNTSSVPRGGVAGGLVHVQTCLTLMKATTWLVNFSPIWQQMKATIYMIGRYSNMVAAYCRNSDTILGY